MNLFQPKVKTLDDVLKSAHGNINDLIIIADREADEAHANEVLAINFKEDAMTSRRKSAHASILSNRLSSLITVSDEEIDKATDHLA